MPSALKRRWSPLATEEGAYEQPSDIINPNNQPSVKAGQVHTAETGQRFTPEAVAAVWDQTRGQPWLVNALAKEMCFEHEELHLRDRPLAERDVFEACEALILRRETHLDQLTDKLREPRVRRVIEPLLRHARGQELGGPGVPRGGRAWREADHRVGGLTMGRHDACARLCGTVVTSTARAFC